MTQAQQSIKTRPVQIPGKAWDVEVTMPDGSIKLLCAGRAPYTMAQAQAAAQAVKHYAARHGVDSLDFS